MSVGGGGDPALSLPGSFLAIAMTSASEFTGSEGCDMITIGVDEIVPIGAKSFVSKPVLAGSVNPVVNITSV